MFRIKYLVLLMIFTFLFGIYNVSAKVCNYPDVGVTIRDGHLDGSVIAIPIPTPLIIPAGVVADSTTEISEEVQYVLNGDNCASNIYVCRYNGFSVEDDSLVNPDFWKNFSWDSIVGLFPNANFQVDRKLLFDEESFKKSKYYYVYDRGGWAIGNDWLDNMGDAYNACSGYNIPVLNVVTGILCLVGEGTLDLAAGHYFRDDKWLYIYTINCQMSKSDDPDAIDANCSALGYLKKNYQVNIEEYKSCGEDKDCKALKGKKLSNIESQVRSYCGSITKNYNYDESQSSCLENCFSAEKDLNDMRVGTDLYRGLSKGSQCGVSDKLINWIANILKWGKYLVPVLVIILGILDFIKAIVSQSDDEMKKVQKRFVIRLVVAALFFLVPFILEFVLRAFNLLTDNPYCGLI